MQQSLEMIKITQRLKERCNCFDCENDEILQGYMEKFLNVLARLFCWVDGECSTLLKAQRKEILPLASTDICGCEAMVEIKPFYHKGFDPSSLQVFVQKRQGMKRETYEITKDKYNWSFVDGTILIDVSKEVNPCCSSASLCECKTEYKLILVYEAGYTSETLPSCVYDAMCHFLNIFLAYQNNCGTLEQCMNMDKLAVGAVLKQKSVDYIVREWVIDKTNIDRVYVSLINRWSLETLSSLSLCNSVYTGGMFIAIGRKPKC